MATTAVDAEALAHFEEVDLVHKVPWTWEFTRMTLSVASFSGAILFKLSTQLSGCKMSNRRSSLCQKGHHVLMFGLLVNSSRSSNFEILCDVSLFDMTCRLKSIGH